MIRIIPRGELSLQTKDHMRDRRRDTDREYIEYHKIIAEKCRRRRHAKQ